MEAWRKKEHRHLLRADQLTAAHRERRARNEPHPVDDFLWTYYSLKPGELRRWHPGAGVALAEADERRVWKYYGAVGHAHTAVDLERYFAKRAATVDYVETLLRGTLTRTPRFNCFGMHEWAMVYRMSAEQLRHTSLPLRIGQEATDRVVESHPITCTHFDAFRFFTPEAAPLNTLQPTRKSQADDEQAGCLHAGMDIYKWAAKLGPIVPGELLLDAFVFASDIREVDMRASPYDVSAYRGASGNPLPAIAVETPEGKREYARLQRGFTVRGNALRERLLDAIAVARDPARVAHTSEAVRVPA